MTRLCAFFAVVPTVLFWSSVICAEPAAAPASDPQTAEAEKQIDAEIVRHIQNLGSTFAETANSAEESLLKLGYRAGEALQKASGSPKPEVATRAARIWEQINVHTHVVRDALNQPIAGGRLTAKVSNGELVFTPDARGHISLPQDARHGYTVRASFAHPEYGSINLMIKVRDDKKDIVIPSVRRGTPEYDRALRGRVLGPDNQPLAGAVIKCNEVRTPGEGLISVYGNDTVTSDEKGWFAFYPPAALRGEHEDKAIVPPNSRYFITVETPADESLFPCAAECPNTGEATVRVERGERFHKFKFEWQDRSFIDDPRQLREISVTYLKKSDARPVSLKPHFVVNGGKLLPGTYRARSPKLVYLQLEVTSDSPDELIFRLPPAGKWRGKVIDGITGKPMAKVLVFGYWSTSQKTLAQLSADDWRELRKMPERPDLAHPALSILSRHYGLRYVTRTNDEGAYELIHEPGHDIYAAVAAAENFLPVQYGRTGLKFDEHHVAQVPDLPLFPAAKVAIKPVVRKGQVSIMPHWRFEKDGQPEWFTRLTETTTPERRFEFGNWMGPNEVNAIYVPAEVGVRIQLSAPYSEEYSALLLPQLIKLRQGETLEMGEAELPSAVRLDIEVTDPQGAAVEGIVVRRIYENENVASLPHVTDRNGKTFFYVNRNSGGSFHVYDRATSQRREMKSASAPFKVSETAPTNPTKIALNNLSGSKSPSPAGK